MDISTIIPTYNRASLIAETLRSVLGQTKPPAEVIVVDDGSTDGTMDVLSSFGTDIRVIRQENQGPGIARNYGFREARGNFIHFMDSDDVVSINTYEMQAKCALETASQFIYGPWLKTKIEEGLLYPDNFVIQAGPLPEWLGIDSALLRGWVTVLQPCLIDRRLIEKIGPYRTDLKPSEDTEFLYRVGKSGAKFQHTPNTLLLYRIHEGGQISIDRDKERLKDWARLLQTIEPKESAKQDAMSRLMFDWHKLDTRMLAHKKKILIGELKINTFAHVTGLASLPLRRALARWRRSTYGENLTSLHSPAEIADHQRGLISDLGYEIAVPASSGGIESPPL